MKTSSLSQMKQFGTSAVATEWTEQDLINVLRRNGYGELAIQRAVQGHREQVARG